MRQTTPLDEQTYLAVHAALTRARRGGWDPAEVLHENGLVLAPAVRRLVVVGALEMFAGELERWHTHEFARRVAHDRPLTPVEMHEAIKSYLHDYIAVQRKGPGS